VFRRLEKIRGPGFSHLESAPPARQRRAIVSPAVPARLKPTAPIAPTAILVGDPGRSLLLAQELLEQPKMSNHARGLWGYGGRTAAGEELTIQATGMGGPSAAIVLADLAELGVKRAVRIGTCVGGAGRAKLGELLLPGRAVALGGSSSSFGLRIGDSVEPHAKLLGRLGEELQTSEVVVTSFDTMTSSTDVPEEAVAADMQTVAVLAHAQALGIAAAAVLIVSEVGDERIESAMLEEAAKRAGQAAAKGLG
jgi:uridine phosphorylase